MFKLLSGCPVYNLNSGYSEFVLVFYLHAYTYILYLLIHRQYSGGGSKLKLSVGKFTYTTLDKTHVSDYLFIIHHIRINPFLSYLSIFRHFFLKKISDCIYFVRCHSTSYLFLPVTNRDRHVNSLYLLDKLRTYILLITNILIVFTIIKHVLHKCELRTL